MNSIKPSIIWERILETGNLEELDFLLHLVLTDEESIQVILTKLSAFEEDPEVELHLKVSNLS